MSPQPGESRPAAVEAATARSRRAGLWAIRLIAAVMLTLAILGGVNSFEDRSAVAGNDFVGFYAPAQIIRTDPSRLYDLDLQRQLHRQLAGLEDGHLPYVHAPFLALLLAPLSLLPFETAYWTWMGCSALLYGAAVAMLSPPRFRHWAVAFAFAYPVFPMYVMGAGQITAIDCFAAALGIRLQSGRRLFLCGVILSLLVHKPMLPFYITLMFLARRQWRPLAGLAAGSLSLAVLSVAVIGKQAFWDLILINLDFGRTAASGKFRLMKYVDLGSFSRLLPLPPALGITISLLLALVVLAAVLYCWRRGTPAVAWAATLTAAVLLVPYGPIYDASFLALAVTLLSHSAHSAFLPKLIIPTWPLVLLSQAFADLAGVQLLTLLGVGVAVSAIAIARASARRPHESMKEASAVRLRPS